MRRWRNGDVGMRASGPGLGFMRRMLRARAVRPISVGAVVLLVTAVAAPAVTPTALALGAGQTVDLRVLLIGGTGGATDPTTAAWATGLDQSGRRVHREVDATGTLGSETVTLPALTSSATHGLYNGVVLAGKPGRLRGRPAHRALHLRVDLRDPPDRRQLVPERHPRPELGHRRPERRTAISGTHGHAHRGRPGSPCSRRWWVRCPFDTGTFGSPGTVASPLPTGATETPLLKDASGNVLIGVFQHPTDAAAPSDPQAGIAEMTHRLQLQPEPDPVAAARPGPHRLGHTGDAPRPVPQLRDDPRRRRVHARRPVEHHHPRQRLQPGESRCA